MLEDSGHERINEVFKDIHASLSPCPDESKHWYSLLVHRDYVHRIHDWVRCYPKACGLYAKDGQLAHPIHDYAHYYDSSESVVYVASMLPQRRQGKGQSVELYAVLVVYTIRKAIETLPAMAKRAIRRIDLLVTKDNKPLECNSIQEAANVTRNLLQRHSSLKKVPETLVPLRMDIFPKTKQTASMSDEWIDALLIQDADSTLVIEGCPSASNAKFVCLLIELEGVPGNEQGRYLIGLATSQEFQFWSHQLNEHATSQLPVDMDKELEERQKRKIAITTDSNDKPQSGDSTTNFAQDEKINLCLKDAIRAQPQSRAFYKMKELLEVVLDRSDGSFSTGWLDYVKASSYGAVDLGASPGGWTQALRGGGGPCAPKGGATVPRVLSIDAGALTRPVLALGGVTHVNALFPSPLVKEQMAQQAPFSFVCCDSNRDYGKTMNDLISMCTQVRQMIITSGQTSNQEMEELNHNAKRQKILEENNAVKSSINPKPQQAHTIALFAPICVFILTIKFTHKRTKAIQSMLDESITPRIQSDLNVLAGLTERNVPYQMFHLMSNSVSERTIIANIGMGDLT